MAHAVVHFEIGGPDDWQLAEFYGGLFGWSMRPVPGVDYTLVDTCAGEGVSGGVHPSPEGAASVTFYIEADDLQAVLDKVNLLGGKTVTPITDLPGMVTYARFEDLDGLVIGLVLGPGDPGAAGQSGLPGPSAGEGAPVDWFEVLGSDAGSSQRFYAEIFGWQAKAAGPGYGMIDTGTAKGIRGGIGGGQQGIWATVYARVPDVEALLAKAEELGGTRELGPVAVDDHTQTGALRDPAGNIFGVYSRGPHDSL
jgi:uncharacterized protein